MAGCTAMLCSSVCVLHERSPWLVALPCFARVCVSCMSGHLGWLYCHALLECVCHLCGLLSCLNCLGFFFFFFFFFFFLVVLFFSFLFLCLFLCLSLCLCLPVLSFVFVFVCRVYVLCVIFNGGGVRFSGAVGVLVYPQFMRVPSHWHCTPCLWFGLVGMATEHCTTVRWTA